MKITAARTQMVRLPMGESLAGEAGLGRSHLDFVTLRLETDAGVEGMGVTFFGATLTPALKLAMELLGESILGEDPLPTEFVIHKLQNIASSSGPAGISTLALAAFDIALWDLKGKVLGQSIAQMLGGLRKRVPTYASGALSRAAPLDEVLKSA